ncbi:maleylpyruvate isomerase N-terminal domain-containing protein [Ruania alkalisoli]|uniref:Maleylpyruvate isomerase N-terminal domain-containing protein n=1 Tax=Ruania alkalisoli TaxID=2779775 RepID=A0A7M1SXD1_9MICO|nr:maleylpyruvate isomerase N-terminal domain-containing protein [Ruania alkalisoli]QOR71392.1 maleylpyruvate isomerase N-terminal domain-containing protein [Ruania alkalisoli]
MVTLTRYCDELRDQWDLLRERLDDVGSDVLATPSSLPGWTVGDLMAHLGRALDAITACEPDPSAEPLSVADYLSSYAADADRIDRVTREMSQQIADDPLAGLDAVAERAFAHLDALAQQGDVVVRGRRGAIKLPDFVLTRLIELVVHGYDLAPALAAPAPVDAGARQLVAQAFAQVVADRTGVTVLVDDAAVWIRVASGRGTWDEVTTSQALRPEFLSDGLTDLRSILPLL